MANDEHVALLKRGVTAWNAWRKKNRQVHVNLRGADLRNANLRGVDLSKADFIGQDLCEFRAHPGQNRRLQAQGSVGRRHGSARL
jgi:uncharacterized protein YjbI with pentapeptide repeats